MEAAMLRRNLLKAAAAAALTNGLTVHVGHSERAKPLVFVPTSDLAVLDPIVTFNRPTRNYAYLVFDTLYGIDTNWQAQPQMVQGHEVEDDGFTWLLKLREGLRFHDTEPVLPKDVVSSIRRFAPRIPFVSALMAATDELSASDDRAVRFRLKRPFPHLPLASPGRAARCQRSCRNGWRRHRHSSRSARLSAAGPSASSRTSTSAAPVRRSPASISIGHARAAPRGSPRGRTSRISNGSNG